MKNLYVVLALLAACAIWNQAHAAGVVNGQPVNASTVNNAFLYKNGNDSSPYSYTLGGLSLTAPLAVVNGGTGVTTSTGTGSVVLQSGPTITGSITLPSGVVIPGTYGTLEVAGSSSNGSVSVINNTAGGWAFRKVRSDGSNGMGVYDPSGFGQMAFYTAGSERMRIDNTGKVDVVSSGSFIIGDSGSRTAVADSLMVRRAGADNTIYATFISEGFATNTIRNESGAGKVNLAFINDASGNFSFQTGSAEALKISTAGTTIGSAGNVGHVIQNSSTAQQTLLVNNASTSTSSDVFPSVELRKGSTTNTAGVNKFINFTINAGATVSGYIGSNGASNAAFFAGSDRRIKKDIEDLPGALDKINELRPRKFRYRSGNYPAVGFIAQELNEVFPQFVAKTDDGKGENLPHGVENWSVTESGFVPYLVKAIQELSEKNTALEARISRLESK